MTTAHEEARREAGFRADQTYVMGFLLMHPHEEVLDLVLAAGDDPQNLAELRQHFETVQLAAAEIVRRA